MHILIATPHLPWPLIDGGRVAQYRTFEALQNACTFTLVVPIHSMEEEADAKKFAGKFPNVTVEAVRCYYIPPPASWRARLRRIAAKLLRTLFSAPKVSHSAQNLNEAVPAYPFSNLDPAFVKKVEEEFAKGCDIFQAEFADMLTLGPLMAGRVPSIFVHHQLHFIYAKRFLKMNNVTSSFARYITERMGCEEVAYLKKFDVTIVLSEVDRKLLKKFCSSLEISVSPCPSPEDPLLNISLFAKPTNRFVFVASEAHHPNIDGLRWFMKEVWPEIKDKLPSASIEVIGKWSPSAQAGLPNYKAIQFTGFVPELMKSLQNKIMIVPVWVGSGIRTKILAAWSASCPVITTTVGVEGLPGQSGEHFIVADNAPAFASACIELSQDILMLNRIATNGLDLVQRHYSLAAVRKTRLDIYEKLLATYRKQI